MKTFIVEGVCWRTSVQINEELFEKEMDMAFEAMTQGVERFINEDERIELVGEECPALGFFMAAYDSSEEDDSNKALCLTEKLLVNGGFYDIATEFERQMHGAIEQEQKDKKNKKKKP